MVASPKITQFLQVSQVPSKHKPSPQKIKSWKFFQFPAKQQFQKILPPLESLGGWVLDQK